MGNEVSRRAVLAGGATIPFLTFNSAANGQNESSAEIELFEDAPLGEMGEFDANFLGPAATRAPRGPFVFPDDAESDTLYGIDISHWTNDVPWAGLKGARVNYVYIKASQGARARDGMFEKHWSAAKLHGMPRGAYHWLTPGVSGEQQGNYFVSRIRAAGGLAKGDMQPVIDLEWDFLGKDFKRTPLAGGRYKDYWSDIPTKAIVTEVSACLDAVKRGFPDLNVRPIIYTNRSWWDERLTPSTRLDATVWVADYRKASYPASPRTVIGHEYNLWQFTEKGVVKVDGKRYGPMDCNKIIKGDLSKLIIA